MEICQVKVIMRERLSVELGQVCVPFLCELPNYAAGDLHFPISSKVMIPYLLVKNAYLCVINN